MRKWGQHFLMDQQFLRKIVGATCLSSDDAVLEIGPGRGALTSLLVRAAGKVLAVEVDPSLCRSLQKEYGGRVHVLNRDFLDISENEVCAALGSRWKITANLPFYITSPILNKIVSWDGWELGVLTVQKEVGERVCAPPGTRAYGLLSIMVQVHADPAMLFVVPRQAFSPPPKVDAAVILLRRRACPLVDRMELDHFFAVLRPCFQSRRKIILNSFSRGMGIGKREAESMLRGAGIDPGRRPEAMSIEECMVLSRLVKERTAEKKLLKD